MKVKLLATILATVFAGVADAQVCQNCPVVGQPNVIVQPNVVVGQQSQQTTQQTTTTTTTTTVPATTVVTQFVPSVVAVPAVATYSTGFVGNAFAVRNVGVQHAFVGNAVVGHAALVGGAGVVRQRTVIRGGGAVVAPAVVAPNIVTGPRGVFRQRTVIR